MFFDPALGWGFSVISAIVLHRESNPSWYFCFSKLFSAIETTQKKRKYLAHLFHRKQGAVILYNLISHFGDLLNLQLLFLIFLAPSLCLWAFSQVSVSIPVQKLMLHGHYQEKNICRYLNGALGAIGKESLCLFQGFLQHLKRFAYWHWHLDIIFYEPWRCIFQQSKQPSFKFPGTNIAWWYEDVRNDVCFEEDHLK